MGDDGKERDYHVHAYIQVWFQSLHYHDAKAKSEHHDAHT